MSEPDHSDVSREPNRSHWPAWLAIGILVLYPLSTGPAAMLYQHHLLPESVLQILYAPIIYVCDHNATINDALEWYVEKIWHVQ
jgi:hypothetical protein